MQPVGAIESVKVDDEGGGSIYERKQQRVQNRSNRQIYKPDQEFHIISTFPVHPSASIFPCALTKGSGVGKRR